MLTFNIPTRIPAGSSRRRRWILVPMLAALVAVTLASPAGATASDAVAPTTPGPLEVTELTTTSVTLRWAASVDDVAVIGYQVRQGFEDTGQTRLTATNSITITGLMRARTYGFVVRAYDAAGNFSGDTSWLQVTMEPGDHAPPTAPGAPVASSISATSLILSWLPSTDDGYVEFYRVFGVVGGELVRVMPSPPRPNMFGNRLSWLILYLAPETTYTFVLQAVDEVGRVSPLSPPVTVTTAAAVPSCVVDYRVTRSWPGGFQAAVRVTNTTAQPVSTWQLGWLFPSGQTVRHLWSGVLHGQVAGLVTVRNEAWNATIAPGGSVEVGFVGTRNTANAAPQDFTLDGKWCGALPIPPPS
ncbi:MAG TPA: cellulose binding domain-containing protein [Micromonosporaceae bacterium]|nr:cellulose binding domain-containing protein [Micromonosporaceae bacterium]